MRGARLRRRRSQAQQAVLGVFALVVLLISSVAAGLLAYLTAATDSWIQSALAEVGNSQTAVQLSARGGDGLADQHAGVTQHLSELLAGVPYDLYRSESIGPRTIFDGASGQSGNELTRGLLISYEDLLDHAELVAGEWPGPASAADAMPLAVHVGSAANLGLELGDLLSVGHSDAVVTLQVSALYQPVEPASAFWYGESREIEGSAEGTGLVAAMDQTDIAQVPGADVTTRWRLEPDVGQLQPADVRTLRTALTRLPGRLAMDARLARSQLSFDDKLSGVIQQRDDQLRATRSVAMVPLVLLGLVSVIALALVSRLLAMARTAETALLRSRGASTWLLAGWTAREAVSVVVIPATCGGLAAWFVLRATSDLPVVPSASALIAGAMAAAVLGAITMVLAGTRAAAVTVQATVERRATSARRHPVLRAGTVPVVLIVAAVTLWQLRRYGSPFGSDAAGVLRSDPLGLIAPAAALLAGSVLVAVSVTGLAWVAERLARRLRGLSGALAVRQVARRPAAHVLPVVLLAVTAGAGTLASGLTATWDGLQSDVAAQRVGADLQVVLRGGSPFALTPASHNANLRSYREVSGVERVQPVVSVPHASIADGAVELLARPLGAGGLLPGVALPSQAESIELVLEIGVRATEDRLFPEFYSAGNEADEIPGPDAAPVHARLWVADADGLVSVLATEPVLAPPDGLRAPYLLELDLPAGQPPWRVVGIELLVNPPKPDGFSYQPWAYDYDIELAALRTDPDSSEVGLGAPDQWRLTRLDSGTDAVPELVDAPTSRPGLHIGSRGLAWSGLVHVRFSRIERDVRPLDVTATTAALDRFGLDIGDQPSLRVFGTELPVEIVGDVAAVPGTSTADAMTADLTALTATMLATGVSVPAVNHIWIDATPEARTGGTVAAAVAEVAGENAQVLDRTSLEEELRGDVIARLSLVTFWVASGASALLAVAGLVAAAALLVRQRRPDVAVLRSVGASPGQQASARWREQAVIAGYAVGLGAGVGWLITTFTATLLAKAATPTAQENLQPVLRLAAGPWAAYLVTLLLLCVLVAGVHGARVGRQGSRPPTRGGLS